MALVESSQLLCRICLAESNSKHSFALLSLVSIQQDWPIRATELVLQVPIVDEEHLPRHLCKNCKAKVLSVEEKLQTLLLLQVHSRLFNLREGVGYGFREVCIIWKHCHRCWGQFANR